MSFDRTQGDPVLAERERNIAFINEQLSRYGWKLDKTRMRGMTVVYDLVRLEDGFRTEYVKGVQDVLMETTELGPVPGLKPVLTVQVGAEHHSIVTIRLCSELMLAVLAAHKANPVKKSGE